MFGFGKKKSARPTGPDFSEVDSQKKAIAMYRRGELEKLFLMPLEFGGQDIPNNVLYVPIGVAAAKARIDNGVIAELVRKGKVTEYTANAKYQGESFIPSAIEIVASDPGKFTTTIAIWGDALTEEE
jgi:hypothetical protein